MKRDEKHLSIPEQYKKFWVPFKTKAVLYHLTTEESLQNIKKTGFIEPRDPSPKYRAGIKAIFLAYPLDSLYEETLKHVLAHVKAKQENLIRLHIRTSNNLYKSVDPERTFQVISLDPIPYKHIISIEKV